MTDGLFSTIDLGESGQPGYRLARIEVFNWGTFDSRVWTLTSSGETTLLTGDIGSGKSTLVDAISTLLLPANRIDYNKAAGAGRRERTLRSYVEGHHKTERNETTGGVRPVALRDRHSYSVILGVFVNDGHGETVTLAQVFQQQETTGQPWRRFITASRDMSVHSDFAGFGSDVNDLLKRLRTAGATVEKDFPPYGRTMRRLLGIRSEQAMELFLQTVSMKAVGDLNEFVRTHMLEPADAGARVQTIIKHFEDLTRAYESVQNAREQLTVLGPLRETAERYDDALARRADLQRQRDAVRLFFAELRIRLREAEIAAAQAQQTGLQRDLQAVEGEQQTLDEAHNDLIAAQARAGGDRKVELERLERDARTQAGERKERRAAFDAAVTAADLPVVADHASFAELTAQAQHRREQIDQEASSLKETYDALVIDHGEQKRLARGIDQEIRSLEGRRSNLPEAQLQIRQQLCADLGADEAELPYAGELLDVDEDHGQWRGAAERVLRGFALSLLVPQRHYAAVADWVNSRRLTARRADGREGGARLVYQRVPDRQVPLRRPETDALLLADVIEIDQTPLRDYLRNELLRRADHRCALTIEEFRQADRAVTREGQVRSRERHEKDDRRAVDDPRSWVLGWRNAGKIAALRDQLAVAETKVTELAEQIDSVEQTRNAGAATLQALAVVAAYTSWTELDWTEATQRAEEAAQERQRLIDGNSELAEIEKRLAANRDRAAQVTEAIRGLGGQIATLEDRISRWRGANGADQKTVDDGAAQVLDDARAAYGELEQRLGGRLPGKAEQSQQPENELTDELDKEIERRGRELGGYVQSLLQYMNEIHRRWPQEATEMDRDVEARADYVQFHQRVAQDDLPRFEAEFKDQLNTNAIRELAGFRNWLQRQAEEIHDKIDRINEALGAIDFNPGRYVRIEPENTVNQDVRQFRSDLRALTDDSLDPDDQYSEQRYEEVRRIIERFRGREGHAESDRKWTERVTDVRNWYTFSASERDRQTDIEWEHYRDSDGKSGGQKEKLAYTILAASLAYQFGLSWGVQKSKDFRFAVIDEAFGRGSDVSTRYALELFAKLGLQLLIVTPLQKVHVIAPYVRSIGYVDNPGGSNSRLTVMTTEEYEQMREGRR